MISREEAERTLTFSSNPSSAFLISAVGVSLWENRRFGVVLYVTVLLASLISGILANLLRTDKEDRVSEIPVSSVPYPKLRWAQIFTGAVGSATGGILLVCAYVIFFSALIGTLNYVLGAFHLPDAVHATIFCLFELSGGVSRASALGNAVLGALLCAFAAGWSGLSVHCQILSVCDGSGLSLRPYFAAKFLQGGLCVLLLALFLFIDPTLLIPSVGI